MSDAPAAKVTEQGVPPATQTEEAPSFKVTYCPLLPAPHHLSYPLMQVFIGNLAYSTTDQGLKAFFEPVQSDVYAFFSTSEMTMLITNPVPMDAASPPRL